MGQPEADGSGATAGSVEPGSGGCVGFAVFEGNAFFLRGCAGITDAVLKSLALYTCHNA